MSLNPQASKQTNGMIRLTWTPDLTVFGYRFYRDGVAVAKGTRPEQASTTFKAETDGKSHWYGIARALEQVSESVQFPEITTPPPPTVGKGRLGLIPNGGFPGDWGAQADSLKPAWLREDHLSAALVDWAASRPYSCKVLGLATRKNTAETMALLAQYPSISAWELGNEPYFESVNVATWARMMRDTAKAVKAKYPTYTVGVPILVQTNGGDYNQGGATGWAPWVNQMLDAAPDLPAHVDFWGAHPYGPTPAVCRTNLEKMRGQLVARGCRQPIWWTEFGWSVANVSEQQQADYTKQLVDWGRTTDWNAQEFVYCLKSWGPDKEGAFGFFNVDKSERRAAGVFRSYTGTS